MNTLLKRQLAVLAVLSCAACGDGSDGSQLAFDDAATLVPDASQPQDAALGADALSPVLTDAAVSPDASATGAGEAGTDGAALAQDAQLADAAPDAAVGNGGVLSETIVIKKGQSFDGGGKRYTAGAALGDGSQSESQKPMFKLEDGASLSNVVLGAPAADGIHTYGNVTLSNIVWEDIGEDALTIKQSGTVVLRGGSARNGSDKVFQINAASTFRVSDFTASDAGKFIRQNGGTTFKVEVFIEHCDIARMDESIFRTDSSSSTVSMTNSRFSQIGDALFMGVTPANIVNQNNTEY